MGKAIKTEEEIKIYNTIGENIKTFRRAAGVSQKDIAKVLAITHQQLNKYETGVDRISIAKLCSLCQIFDISLDQLLGEDKRNKKLTHSQRMALNLGRYFVRIKDPELQRAIVLLVRLILKKFNSKTKVNNEQET